MLTIAQDMALRRMQKGEILLDYMSEEQKVAALNAFTAAQESNARESKINSEMARLQGELNTIAQIKAETVISAEKIITK
jgi:hypothetical protein